MKSLVGAFNQEKALVGASSVIVKTSCGTDGALDISGSLYSQHYRVSPTKTNFIILFLIKDKIFQKL